MRSHLAVTLIACLLPAALAAQAPFPAGLDGELYFAPRIDLVPAAEGGPYTVTLDGRLNDPVWQRAAFHTVNTVLDSAQPLDLDPPTDDWDMIFACAADHDFLVRHFRNPQATTPGSVMPKMNLLEDEIQALTAYVLSLGGGAAFTKEAPKLFADSCASCHKIGSEGGEIGPDLSTIGQVREAAYLRRYIADPAQINPSSAMPGFKGDLTDVQIEDLARYLAHQR